jgi:hypothetical protein
VRTAIVTKYLTRRIEMAKYLQEHRSKHESSDKFGFWLRWLGGEMALRAEQYKDVLSELYNNVQACNPVLLWLEGMEELKELSLDPEDSVENPDCIAVFLLPYLQHTDEEVKKRIHAVIQHCLDLSRDNEMHAQWQELEKNVHALQ